MKLQGVCLTLPVCDRRPFLAPKSRLPFLDTLNVDFGQTFLKGFGPARERPQLRFPWWPQESIYYHCGGALSLPQILPDDVGVTNTVRRLYLDTKALVRFELATYRNIRHRYPKTDLSPRQVVLKYWDTPIKVINRRGAKEEVLLPEGLNRLVTLFGEQSSSSRESTSVHDLCVQLAPQLQVIIACPRQELPEQAEPLDDKYKIALESRSVSVPRKSSPLDVAYLFYDPTYLATNRSRNFDRFRFIRRNLSWLHAQLKVLDALMRTVLEIDCKDANPGLNNYIRDLSSALNRVARSPEDFQLLSQILWAPEHPFRDRLLRLSEDLGRHDPSLFSVPEEVGRISEARENHSSQGEYRRGFGNRVTEALAALRATFDHEGRAVARRSKIHFARYDDDDFRESAKRKAKGVLRRLPDQITPDATVFVSVGGADGAELLEFARLAGNKYGILLDISDESVESARAEATRRGLSLYTYVGDAMGKLEMALERASSLKNQHNLSGVVVSAQAILHEFPTRSGKYNDPRDYFRKLGMADVVIGREPVEPENWDEDVLLMGVERGRDVARLGMEIKKSLHKRFGNEKYWIREVNESIVEGHRALLVETLTKIFYAEDLLYELEECVTSHTGSELYSELELCLGDTHSCWYECLPSGSIREFWSAFGLKACRRKDRAEFPLPLSHCWYVAHRMGGVDTVRD